MYKISVLILFILIIAGCAERDRTNIFDPESGIDTLNLSLYITRADNLVNLEWFRPAKTDYQGFNLYRRIYPDEQYALLASLPSDQFIFSDYNTEFEHTYSYFLRLQGADSESPQTRSVHVTPGPLSFWILDRYGLNIFRATYDLRHTRLTKYAVWVPEDLAVDPVYHRVLVTYPQYRFAEIFDLDGGKTEINLSRFGHPFGCIYEPDLGKFWLTDSSGYLYTIDPVDGTAELVDRSLLKPTQIVNTDVILYLIESDRKQIVGYDKSGNKTGNLKTIRSTSLVNPVFIEPVVLTGDLFIIDQDSTIKTLYKYDLEENKLNELYRDKNLKAIRFDPKSATIWLAIDNKVNSSIMQLSADGVRLKMLNGFSGISDFRYNPGTASLVVVDSGERLVKHIRQDASIIGIFNKAIYPSKVFTE